jgi:hypothetical protein
MASQTLQGYITQVRWLLHDANANFYTNPQLTSYINTARERIVRDTGCLRQIQVTTTPTTPVAGGPAPYFWTAGGTPALGDYVVYNIYIYKVLNSGGVFSNTAPPYPSSNTNYPPSTPFYSGTVELQYAGPSEVINWSCLPQGLQTLDIININLYWGNTRVPQRYLPWTQFNAELRFWQNYIGRPIAFSNYGQGQTYLAPVPDQVYTIELDTVVLPTELVNLNDVDSINDPYYTPVQYYAAYLAKYYEQSFGEAEIFKQEYLKHTQAVLVSTYTRRMPDPYSTPY